MISDNLQQVNLTPDDVDGAMALSTEAGWNQTADDWRHFISQGTTIGVNLKSSSMRSSLPPMRLSSRQS